MDKKINELAAAITRKQKRAVKEEEEEDKKRLAEALKEAMADALQFQPPQQQ